MAVELSKHAEQRIRQRGLRESDPGIIVDYGTPMDGKSVYLLRRDADREISKLKKQIAALDRLRGCRVILTGEDKVVTVYRAPPKTEKRLLRGAR